MTFSRSVQSPHPGGTLARPVHLIPVPDPLERIAQAKAALSLRPDQVDVADMDDGGVRVVLKPRPREMWKILALGFTASILSLAGAIFLTSHPEVRPDGLTGLSISMKFYFLAAALMGISLLALLLHLSAGKPKETILEVWPGRLKVDRYLSWDHIVRECPAKEIKWLWVDLVLSISTRMDTFTVSMFSSIDVHVATGELVAVADPIS
jgi:hypothetical protein